MRRSILAFCGRVCLISSLIGPLATQAVGQSGSYSLASDRTEGEVATAGWEEPVYDGPVDYDYAPGGYHARASACGGGVPCYHTVGGWTGGYEQTIVKPTFSEPFGVSPSITSGSLLVFEPPLATFDYEAAPRAWVGYVGCRGLGFRGRYWGFDQEANEAIFIDFPQLGLDTVTTGSLNVQEVDIEATQEACFCAWLVTMSGGVRLARTEMESNIVINDGVTINLFDHEHEFEGVGPTFAVEVMRPILGSNFALFGNGRCSLVFGNTEASTTVVDEFGVPTTFSESTDDMLSILELQVGTQWSCCVGRGARLFVRGGFEGQIWSNAGNLYTTDSDLGFVGFDIGVGLMR